MGSAFVVWGLPVLQSLVATGISQVALADLYSDDGSDNDEFRKIMREAFTNAVKKVRKESSDAAQKNTIVNEFRFYQKVLIDDLVKLEPTDRKKYIEQELYSAFKSELLKSEEALQHISLKLAQEATRNQQIYVQVIDNMHQLLIEANQKLDGIIAEGVKRAAQSGLCPSSIIEPSDYSIWIPPLHAERKHLIDDITKLIKNKQCVLLYAGVKEGKTVTAALLSQQIVDYKIVWLDFAQENRWNLEVVLQQYDEDEKVLFVLDHVRYDNDQLYERLCRIVACKKSEYWLFLIGCYEKMSEILFADSIIPAEYALPPLSEEEVGEMIPEDKRSTYQSFIFALFEGQPMLTHMACVYLQEHGWGASTNDIANLFTFPKGTPIEKKVKRMARQMIKAEDYALLNRLLLLDKGFTADDCAELASVSPIIQSPQEKLDSLCGTWVKEINGHYTISPLLRKTTDIDMLPQERRDCCNLIAHKIIHQQGGITPNDAFRALNMLITSRSGDDAAAFYVLMLYKLDENNYLDHESSMLWRAIWIDVKLPDWMSVENKALVRNAQLLILGFKHHIHAQSITDDLEELIAQMDNKSEIKAACVRVLIAYFLLNNKSDKLPELKRLSAKLPIVPSAFDQTDEKRFIFVALDSANTTDELLAWSKSYKDAGEPDIELIPDGVIMKVNIICDNTEAPRKADVLAQLAKDAYENGYEIVAVVACARWIDILSAKKEVTKARDVMAQYQPLAETDLGNLLLNYSYGLCLNNNGLAEEGLPYIEKACETSDMALACAVLLNASATLAELRAKSGNKEGAVEILSRLVCHKDFNRCYTDYEKGAAFGTYAYALWMVGEKEKATRELLKVEKILWEHREKRDNDYKNLSMRFSVLALYMASEEVGRPVDDGFAKPDYGLFVKIAPTLLDGYKPERNFTMLYAVYHLTELVLADENAGIDVIEHMLEMQRSDAATMASLLSALMQAYPLFLLNDRFDMLEYSVLTSLAGVQATKENSPISFESFVLINAIATWVMKRTILIADGKEIDDDALFDMIGKAVKLLPNHDLTDGLVTQMKRGNPDYASLKDIHAWGILAAYHIKDITPEMGLSAIYAMVKTLLEPNNFPTAIKYSDLFVKSFAYLLIKEHGNRFNIELKDFERYFSRANGKHGMEYLRSIMQGLFYKLKTEPVLDKDIMDFIDF